MPYTTLTIKKENRLSQPVSLGPPWARTGPGLGTLSSRRPRRPRSLMSPTPPPSSKQLFPSQWRNKRKSSQLITIMKRSLLIKRLNRSKRNWKSTWWGLWTRGTRKCWRRSKMTKGVLRNWWIGAKTTSAGMKKKGRRNWTKLTPTKLWRWTQAWTKKLAKMSLRKSSRRINLPMIWSLLSAIRTIFHLTTTHPSIGRFREDKKKTLEWSFRAPPRKKMKKISRWNRWGGQEHRGFKTPLKTTNTPLKRNIWHRVRRGQPWATKGVLEWWRFWKRSRTA